MTDNNPDLRERVVESRGFLKKLQLLIPALKEYRKLEDIRAADQLLRKQVFDRLNEAKFKLETIRKTMSDKGDFNNLSSIGTIISQLQQVAGQVNHAQQGSAGISPNIRIDENALNKLYEYDYNFVNSAEQIFSTITDSVTEYSSGASSAQAISTKISPMLEDFKHAWKQRLDSVENILVTK